MLLAAQAARGLKRLLVLLVVMLNGEAEAEAEDIRVLPEHRQGHRLVPLAEAVVEQEKPLVAHSSPEAAVEQIIVTRLVLAARVAALVRESELLEPLGAEAVVLVTAAEAEAEVLRSLVAQVAQVVSPEAVEAVVVLVH